MFLKIPENMTLSQLSNRVSHENVGAVLAANGLSWGPNIGTALTNACNAALASATNPVSWEQQYNMLNRLAQDSDSFEYACLMSDSAWQVYASINTFPGMLSIPGSVQISSGSDTLGNGVPVTSVIYNGVMSRLLVEPHHIDISLFNEYSSAGAAQAATYGDPGSEIFNSFHIPWGEVTLWSSIDGSHVEFPVYPETVDDGVQAEYTTMPDMLYQYEPWYIYKSSGPRSPKYSFHFHRDMWTGDHRDGRANALIRYCQAHCYPDYRGSAVVAPTAALYVAGNKLINGIITAVNVSWSGPIGLDGWYLECRLEVSFTEIADEPLNYTVMRSKPLIG